METILSPTMQEATNLFINNLMASEAFVRYHSHKPSWTMIHRHRLYSTSFPKPKQTSGKSRLKATCRRMRLIP